jgi:putative ABC transport system permease protein
VLHRRNSLFNSIAFRVREGELPSALSHAEAVWDRFVPDRPLQYAFAQDLRWRDYQQETGWYRLSQAMCGAALFVSCIGLWGLVALTAQFRTKEIGIRKVLGASVAGLVALISREFVVMVCLANLVSWPIAYHAMHRWLEGFAYRVEIDAGVFIAAGLIALVVALATVAGHTVRMAGADPTNAIRQGG